MGTIVPGGIKIVTSLITYNRNNFGYMFLHVDILQGNTIDVHKHLGLTETWTIYKLGRDLKQQSSVI